MSAPSTKPGSVAAARAALANEIADAVGGQLDVADGLLVGGMSRRWDAVNARVAELIAAARAEATERAEEWAALTDEQRQQVIDAIEIGLESGDVGSEATVIAIELLGGAT